MKFLLCALLIFSQQALAQSAEAPGKISYKMPSGEIVTRDSTLVVPAMGNGDVILRGSNAEFTAERFFNRRANGRTLFYVVFDEFPGATPGTRVVFRGTYTRGSNMALYYGDVFKTTTLWESDDDLHQQLSRSDDQSMSNTRYAAGFMFKAEIN